MDSIIQVIGKIGFPITISLYLFIRIEGTLKNLTASINNLSQVVSNIKNNAY